MNDGSRPGAWTLARVFNRIALQSFGGGLSAWSREVLVRERGWLTDEESLSTSTISRVLPGANQVNLAVFVGTRMGGLPGAAASVAGLLALPGLALVVIGVLYPRFSGWEPVRQFLSGMAAAAAGLTFSVAFAQARATLRSPVPVGLCAATFLLSAVLREPLWLTMLLCGPAGFAWAWRSRDGRTA